MRKREFQLELEKLNYKSQIGKGFGGTKNKGNPKSKRPFSRKHPTHVIFKSSLAKGQLSFLHHRHRKRIDDLVRRLAKKFYVDLKDYANVGNHLHLLISAPDRKCLAGFLKALSGLVPRTLLGCHKGNPLGYSFWDSRPYSKVIALGRRPFAVIKQYFVKNRRQAEGSYRPKFVEGFDLFLSSA